jgi:hypothetical protein
MALGAARPLQPTDLWKMDDARSAGRVSRSIAKNYYARQKKAKEYNELLADPGTPLPLSKQILYSILPNREKREHDYRTKYGKRKASLAMALSDTFGFYFWMGGAIKVVGDTAGACTPLLIKALIAWVTTRNASIAAGRGEPSVGPGIGYAFGLFGLLVISSFSIHHFFVRKSTVAANTLEIFTHGFQGV